MSDKGLVRAYQPAFWLLQRIADASLIFFAHYVACALYPQSWSEKNTIATAVAIIAFHLVAESTGVYQSWRGAPLRSQANSVLTAWAFVVPVFLFFAFATQQSEAYSRIITTLWFLITPVSLVGLRWVERRTLSVLRSHGRNCRKVAILGATQIGMRLADRIEKDSSLGLKLEFIFDERSPDRLEPVKASFKLRQGHLDELVTMAKRGALDDIYIALPLRAERRISDLIKRLADTTVNVHYAPDFFTFDVLHSRWTQLGDFPVVSMLDSPFRGPAAVLKRIEDIVLGSIILALISIPMLFIGIVVKLSSPGPVFFRQKRYGLNGKEIGVLKFRSMSCCEDGPNVAQAKRNDPRVTRFGAFLRRTSLDELPQFLNVLLGEMSIVGPRPHAVAHNEYYRPLIYGYMLRHKVKPGITGWAQVNGWRGETDTVDKMEKRVEHDLAYINNWNLWWDLQIIIMTMLGRKKSLNAY